jgi:hypothetical protein
MGNFLSGMPLSYLLKTLMVVSLNQFTAMPEYQLKMTVTKVSCRSIAGKIIQLLSVGDVLLLFSTDLDVCRERRDTEILFCQKLMT